MAHCMEEFGDARRTKIRYMNTKIVKFTQAGLYTNHGTLKVGLTTLLQVITSRDSRASYDNSN